jgi:hypothetical protein
MGLAFAEQASTNVIVHRQIRAAEKMVWNAGGVLGETFGAEKCDWYGRFIGAEFSPLSFAPSNLFFWNLYCGHDRMTMDKRRSL